MPEEMETTARFMHERADRLRRMAPRTKKSVSVRLRRIAYEIDNRADVLEQSINRALPNPANQ